MTEWHAEPGVAARALTLVALPRPQRSNGAAALPFRIDVRNQVIICGPVSAVVAGPQVCRLLRWLMDAGATGITADFVHAELWRGQRKPRDQAEALRQVVKRLHAITRPYSWRVEKFATWRHVRLRLVRTGGER